MMVDQEMYLADIRMISGKLEALLYPDTAFSSHNTLYSRVAGVIGWAFHCVEMPPIVSAVFLNVVSQILLALVTVKIYKSLGGKKHPWLFICILFSPTISAYTFFAVRDVFIALFFALFFLHLVRYQYIKALLVSGVFVFLRKFFFVFNFIVIMAFLLFSRVQSSKHKILIGGLAACVIVLSSYALLSLASLSWVLQGVTNVDPATILTSALGLARFVSDSDTVVNAQVGMGARLVMFDSLLMPILMFPSAYVLMKYGNVKEKAISLIVILTTFLLAIGYLIIQGNFPMRKLLPVIPLMFVISFRAHDYLYKYKKILKPLECGLILKYKA